uniref:Ferritin n=1 Tax=Theropithecus gelada TaxID=9565 RepID=A0A8D2K957_THEGE
MTTASTSQVRQNYHQDSEAVINCQINLELYASYVYLSMSYYFVFFVCLFLFLFF